MPLFALDNQLLFPPVELAEPDGLLAAGGDLSMERLLLAYKTGIFPWYESDDILWWSPDPRMVLFPCELKISRSLQKNIKNMQHSLVSSMSLFDIAYLASDSSSTVISPNYRSIKMV